MMVKLLDIGDIGLLSFLGFISAFWIGLGLATFYGLPYAKEVLVGAAIVLGSFFILVIGVTLREAYRYRDLK